MLVTKKILEEKAHDPIIFPEPVSEGVLREILRHIGRSPHGLKVDGTFYGHFLFSDHEERVDKEEVHGTIRNPKGSIAVYFAISKDDLGPRRNGIRFSRIKFTYPPRHESGRDVPSEDEEKVYRLVRTKVDSYFEKRRGVGLSAMV